MISSSKATIGFKDTKFMLVGIPIVSIIVSGILFGHVLIDNPSLFFSSCFVMGFIYTAFYWLSFRELFFYSVRRFGTQNSRRYLFLAPAVVIVYIIVKSFVGFLEDLLFDVEAFEAMVGSTSPTISQVLSSLVLIVLVLALYESSYLNTMLHRSIIEKQDLQRQNIQSQLDGLRNKVNPHFLFNSLNTLCNLIPESPERAESFVRKMSKVYRYILEVRDEKLIPLSEELEYLEAFRFLMNERFRDNLNIEIDFPESYQKMMVVPLSLQILLENAIKHNIISKEKPLLVKLSIDQNGRLAVQNNLQKKRQVSDSTKFGLQNIKERYQFFTDKTVEVINTTQNFIVLLPLINENN